MSAVASAPDQTRDRLGFCAAETQLMFWHSVQESLIGIRTTDQSRLFVSDNFSTAPFSKTKKIMFNGKINE